MAGSLSIWQIAAPRPPPYDEIPTSSPLPCNALSAVAVGVSNPTQRRTTCPSACSTTSPGHAVWVVAAGCTPPPHRRTPPPPAGPTPTPPGWGEAACPQGGAAG